MIKSTLERINEKLKEKVRYVENGETKKLIFKNKLDITFLIFDIPDGIEIIKSGDHFKIFDYLVNEKYLVEFEK